VPSNPYRYTFWVFSSKDDTICAVATPQGIGGIAVIRVSGPSAFTICDGVLSDAKPNRSFSGHTLHRAKVVDGAEMVDDVLVSVFHAPRSYTGEDVVEISCHGGRVPVAKTISLLLRHGCRSAGPGEFTERAFLNEQMDLSQAEAVCDLINAKTEESYRQAVQQQTGSLSRLAEKVRSMLLGILARIEASIDFPEDVGELNVPACVIELELVQSELLGVLRTAERGIMLREGAQVVLVGQTNVGKSSLMNALLRTDRAIVTSLPGTTRDTLEETLDLRGLSVRLLDTAGIRPTDDPIEMIGIERTHSAIAAADLVLHIVDSTVGITDADSALEKRLDPSKTVIVWNKCDIAQFGDIQVSAREGIGIEALEELIADYLLGKESETQETTATVTRARHRVSIGKALGAVANALLTAYENLPPDLLSVDVRVALSAMGELTGENANEDVINEIFSRFCIGK
jgi:tRNA modification GTPase